MMQEGRYKSYFNFLEGEGNDIKNLNMVVQGKEKGSQEEKNVQEENIQFRNVLGAVFELCRCD